MCAPVTVRSLNLAFDLKKSSWSLNRILNGKCFFKGTIWQQLCQHRSIFGSLALYRGFENYPWPILTYISRTKHLTNMVLLTFLFLFVPNWYATWHYSVILKNVLCGEYDRVLEQTPWLVYVLDIRNNKTEKGKEKKTSKFVNWRQSAVPMLLHCMNIRQQK